MKSLKVLCVVAALVLGLSLNVMGEVGIKAGVNMSKLTSMGTISGADSKALIGYQIGLFYGYALTDNIVIQPEVYYVQKGHEYKESGGSAKIDTVLNYIEVPVLFKYKFATEGSFIPSFFVGPYAAFKASAKEKYKGFEDPEENGSIDIKDDVKSTDFGLVFGLGADLKVGETTKFIIDLRYSLGLTKVAKDSIADSKNTSLALLIGLGF